MSLSDAMAHYGWQLTVWQGVWGLSIIAAFAVGLTLGRRIGHIEAPTYWKAVADKWKLKAAVWLERWHGRWRAEREAREVSEDRERILRGASKAYDEAIRRTA